MMQFKWAGVFTVQTICKKRLLLPTDQNVGRRLEIS